MSETWEIEATYFVTVKVSGRYDPGYSPGPRWEMVNAFEQVQFSESDMGRRPAIFANTDLRVITSKPSVYALTFKEDQ